MQDLKIKIVQYDIVWGNKSENFKKIENLLKADDNQEHDLIILPEMFNTGFSMNTEDLAENQDNMSLQFLRKIAEEKDSAVVASFMVKENSNFFNRLFFVRPDGNFKTYNKRHLFRMGDEHKHFTGGNENLIVNYKSWKIKFLICYDLRFPVWSKNKYIDKSFDYDLLVYVANWPKVRVEPWLKLLQARAIENLSYTIGVNRVGVDGKNLEYNGNSVAVDFKGNISDNLEENQKTIDITLSSDELIEFREKFNVGLDWDDFKIIK